MADSPFDVAVIGADKREVARLRHTSVIKVAQRAR